MPDAQQIAGQSAGFFDGIHRGIVAPGEQPESISGTDGVFDIGRLLGSGYFQYLAYVDQVAGQSVQSFNSIHRGIVPLGNEPERVAGPDNIGVSSALRFLRRNVLIDSEIGIIEGFPCEIPYNAVRLQSHDLLEGDNCLARSAAEDAVLGRGGDARIVFGYDIQKVLQGNDVRTPGSLAEYGVWGNGSDSESRSLAVQFRQPGNCGIKAGYLIPGRFSNNTVGGQIKDALEFCNRRFGTASKGSSGIGNGRDSRIVTPDPVEPCLDGLYIKTAASLFERRSGIGRENVGNDIGLHDFYIVGVIGTQDLQRCVPPVCQSNRAPLGHALAGNGGSIAEGSEIRGELPLAAHVFVENIVYNPADGFVNGTSIDEILVVGCAVGNIKTIALVPVRRNRHLFGGKKAFSANL